MTIANVRSLARSNKKEVKRFAKFAIVGAAGSITDFTILNVLIQVFGTSLVLANTVSFTAAVIQNFSLNRLWTFPESQTRRAGGQLLQFIGVSIIGLGINQLVFLTIHHALESLWISAWGPSLGFVISYNFAKLLAFGVLLFFNFPATRLCTYRGLSPRRP